MQFLTILLLSLISSLSFAGSKLVKVDLDDDSPVVVRAELGEGDWYYWVDAKACLCWLGKKDAGPNSLAATFDCKALKAYPKLAEHLSKCEEQAPVAAKAPEPQKPVETVAPAESEKKAEPAAEEEKPAKKKKKKKAKSEE